MAWGTCIGRVHAHAHLPSASCHLPSAFAHRARVGQPGGFLHGPSLLSHSSPYLASLLFASPRAQRHCSAAFASASTRLAAKPTLSPGPGGYNPQPSRPPLRRSASFGSASSRFRDSKTISPGPGAYLDPRDDLGSPRRSQVPPALPLTLPRPTSHWNITLTRTHLTRSRHHPVSPYHHHHALHRACLGRIRELLHRASPCRHPRRCLTVSLSWCPQNVSVSVGGSAAFASTSARTQLPANRSAAIVPGPGGYEHSNPVADYARPLRRSASFASTTARFVGVPKGAAATPAPGSYQPQKAAGGGALAGATQRYSIKRQVLQF